MADENSGAEGDVDLFGAPVGQIRERWGRPRFAKSKENQELVATLRCAGWSHERIARHMGCDAKTLRKHFSRELAAGADLIEGQALQVLIQRMRQGHIPATRLVLELAERGRAAPPPAKEDKPEPPLGKKEQLSREARQPGAGWAGLLSDGPVN